MDKNIADQQDNGRIYKKIKKVFTKLEVMRTYSGKNGVNDIDKFYITNIQAILLCINRCKPDIKNLDFGILLDNVVNRSINV